MTLYHHTSSSRVFSYQDIYLNQRRKLENDDGLSLARTSQSIGRLARLAKLNGQCRVKYG